MILDKKYDVDRESIRSIFSKYSGQNESTRKALQNRGF